MLEAVQDLPGKLLHLGANVYWEYKPLWTWRRLTTPLYEIEIDRPIFILGVQGAGLTLLTRMLHRHEDVVTIGGGRSFWTGLNEMDKHCIRHLPSELTLASPGFQSPTFKDHRSLCGEDHEVFGQERSWVYAIDQMVDRYRTTTEDYTPHLESALKRSIREAIRAYAPELDRARFLDMSQTYSLKLPLLERIFPQAKVVVQSRDPFVLCWRQATGENYRFWKQKPPLDRRLRLAAQHWRNTYRTLLRDVDRLGIEAAKLRFEDLIAHPERELRHIAAHVELEYDPDMVPRSHHSLPLGSGETTKWYPIRDDVNEKYEEEMTDEAKSIVAHEIGDSLELLGYRS